MTSGMKGFAAGRYVRMGLCLIKFDAISGRADLFAATSILEALLPFVTPLLVASALKQPLSPLQRHHTSLYAQS
jgi:hypothetical protein